MLKIFGLYGVKNNNNETVRLMASLGRPYAQTASIKQVFLNQGNTAIIYEALDSAISERFYYIDPHRKIACFIVGNIFKCKDSKLSINSSVNLAKLIIDQYNAGNYSSLLSKLNGEFNIILIDNNKLFIANDKLGLCPMYTYKTQKGFFFSNDSSSIILANKNNYINHKAIGQFIVYGFIPGGNTFVKGLNNIGPATILRIDEKSFICKKYLQQGKVLLGNINSGRINTAKSVNGAFHDAIQARLQSTCVFSDLTGGWDTRFILAHLLQVGIKPVVFTYTRKKEDFEIARLLAKKLKLNHLVSENRDRIKKSVENDKNIFANRAINPPNLSFNNCSVAISYERFLNTPRFTGNFGTEVFGYVPESFRERLRPDFFHSFSSPIFSKNFNFILRDIGNGGEPDHFIKDDRNKNPVYLFLREVGRSYLNTHNGEGWEKPCSFFSFNNLMPFTDFDFITRILRLDYNKYMYYKLYTIIYKTYYPDFLRVPWTFIPRRLMNNFSNSSSQEYLRNRGLGNQKGSILRDLGFRGFISKNKLFKNPGLLLKLRLKETSLLYDWLEVYRNTLSKEDKNLLRIG